MYKLITLAFALATLTGCITDSVQHDPDKATALAAQILGNVLSGKDPGSSYAQTSASFQTITMKEDFVNFTGQLRALGAAKSVQLLGVQSHGSEAAFSVFARETLAKGAMFYQLVFQGSKEQAYRLSALNVSEQPQQKNRLYQTLATPITVALATPATAPRISAGKAAPESTPRP